MRGFLKFLAWTVGILGVVGGALYYFVFDVWTVPDDDPMLTASIAPTLEPGDVVLVGRSNEPKFGQLVRCPNPALEGRYVIGRIVGEADDTVSIANELLSVNNKREVSPGACEDGPFREIANPSNGAVTKLRCGREEFGGMTHGSLHSLEGFEEGREWKVEAGKVFLLSDDLHFHQDSRDVGTVDPTTCQHITFRLEGAAGIGDRARRFTFVW